MASITITNKCTYSVDVFYCEGKQNLYKGPRKKVTLSPGGHLTTAYVKRNFQVQRAKGNALNRLVYKLWCGCFVVDTSGLRAEVGVVPKRFSIWSNSGLYLQ